MTKKWTDIPITKGSRDHLGALSSDFLASKFDEEIVPEADIDLLFNRKSRSDFERELVQDTELDANDRLRFQAEYALERVFARESYTDILELIVFHLQDAVKEGSLDEGLRFTLERNAAQLAELTIALQAWEELYHKNRNITEFSDKDHDPKAMARHKRIVALGKEPLEKNDVKIAGLESAGEVSLNLHNQASQLAKRDNALDKTIPAIVDAKTTIQDVGDVLGQYAEVKSHTKVDRLVGIMQKALHNIAEGYDELEIKKNFSQFSVKNR